MNKKIFLPFIVFLMLVSSSCNFNAILADNTATNSIRETEIYESVSQETDIIVSSSTENDAASDSFIDIDPVFVLLESLESYTEYISSNNMPKDFISYEMIASLGQFRRLTFRDSKNHYFYHYALIDNNELELFVDISRLDAGETLVSEDKSGNEIIYLDSMSSENICYNKEFSTKIIIYNDIAYRYDKNGVLYHVSTIVGNYKIGIGQPCKCLESEGKVVYYSFSEYDTTQENLLTYILSGNEQNINFELLIYDDIK